MTDQIADQPRSDYIFRYRGRPKSHKARVEYYSTLCRLGGQLSTDVEFASTMTKLVRRWRLRTVALRDADWQQIDSPRFAWIRNCRPCGVKVFPKAKACGLRPCPFCHGRRIAEIFYRAAVLVERYQLERRPVQVYSYNCIVGDETCEMPIFEDVVENMAMLEHAVIPKAVGIIRERVNREIKPHILGGIYKIAIEPVRLDDPPTSAAGQIGEWHVHHEALLIADEQAQMPAAEWKLRPAKSLEPSELTWFVGSTFRYPVGWLSGPAEAMAAMLNMTYGQRYSVLFGELRGIPRSY